MKFIKILFLGITAILSIFLIGAALLPKSTTVSRSITISSSPISVYKLVADFHTWNTWSHWSKMDPNQKVTISGADMKIGSEMSWEGRKTGIGIMTITELEEGKSLTISMITSSPNKSSAKNTMTFISNKGGTEVTWTFSSENNYPIGRWMGLMMKGMLGSAFENSLANIKILLENQK